MASDTSLSRHKNTDNSDSSRSCARNKLSLDPNPDGSSCSSARTSSVIFSPAAFILGDLNTSSLQSGRSPSRGRFSKTSTWSVMLSSVLEAATAPPPEPFMLVVKLVVLGAPSVGKTAIIRQFMLNEFPDQYRPTRKKDIYYPTIILNDKIYEIRIVDPPPIPSFPANSFEEWNTCRGYGVRSANAYILVFDITSYESFQYIKSILYQIRNQPSSVNNNESASTSVHWKEDHRHSSVSPRCPVIVVGNKHDLIEPSVNDAAKELIHVIKKQWKCPYVECSAKFNWHIDAVFEEIMKLIDSTYQIAQKNNTTVALQDGDGSRRCAIQ